MTRTEERLREAFADAAQTVKAETLDPLVVAEPPRTRTIRWIAPVAAAVSVGVVVAGALILRANPPSPGAPPPEAPSPSMPRFIVSMISYPKGPFVAEVRDGRTGKTITKLASLKALQAGSGVQSVAAAADGRHFVLFGVTFDFKNHSVHYHAYRLTLDDHGLPSSLTAVPGTALDQDPGYSALSPDGGQLAFNPNGSNRIEVVDLATGRSRSWVDSSLPGGASPNPQWMPDGRHLITVAKTARTEAWFRTVDTQAPGTDLAKVGKVLAHLRLPQGSMDVVISPDGKDVFTEVFSPARSTLVDISAISGKTVRTLIAWSHEPQPMAPIVLDASGRFLLLPHHSQYTWVDGRTGRSGMLSIPFWPAQTSVGW